MMNVLNKGFDFAARRAGAVRRAGRVGESRDGGDPEQRVRDSRRSRAARDGLHGFAAHAAVR